MSFYIRKLRRTLRLIPPASKTLGLGGHCLSTRTRVNERDIVQASCEPAYTNVNSSVSSEAERSHIYVKDEQHSSQILNLESADCQLQSVPAVPHPSTIVPMTLKDLQNIILHRKTVRLSAQAKDVDFFLNTVKSVGLTSDDIVLGPSVMPESNNSVSLVRERVHVDILREKHTRFGFDGIQSERKCVSSHSTSVQTDQLSLHHLMAEVSAGPSGSLSNLFFHTLYCSSGGDKTDKSSNDRPSPEQMLKARERLEPYVLNLFKGRHDYGILHKNVTLENNLFCDNKVCRGITAYAVEILKLRFRVHARYSSVALEIMNVTQLEQSGVIRIHWRLKGIPQLQVLKFWRMFQGRNLVGKDEWEWLEAFSYFHIGKDGLVHKHRIDRMMPDNEGDINKLSVKLRGLLNPAKPLVS